jgi:predicted transcriptional regulator
MARSENRAASRTMAEERLYHRRYLRAVNSPVRRAILAAIREGATTLDALRARTGLDAQRLTWHLQILESGACVSTTVEEGRTSYALTREGRVIEHL